MKPLPPIYSQHDDDFEMRDVIEAFVVDLSARLDDLQDAEMRSDFETLAELSRSLIEDADKAGYPSLVEIGERSLAAAQKNEAEDAHKALVDLTEIVQRVRRGSRGAA